MGAWSMESALRAEQRDTYVCTGTVQRTVDSLHPVLSSFEPIPLVRLRTAELDGDIHGTKLDKASRNILRLHMEDFKIPNGDVPYETNCF